MDFLVVDDHELFRFGLCSIIKSAGDCGNVYESTTYQDARTFLSEKSQSIRYLFLDLKLPDCSGIECLTKIKRAHPKLPIVIVSGCDDQALVDEVISMGVQGYCPKTATSKETFDGIYKVLRGEKYFHPSVVARKTEPEADEKPEPDEKQVEKIILTSRQREVLRLIDKGYTNFQIACTLSISENTVRVHASTIINLLNARNRTEACFLSRKFGLLS